MMKLAGSEYIHKFVAVIFLLSTYNLFEHLLVISDPNQQAYLSQNPINFNTNTILLQEASYCKSNGKTKWAT